MTQVTAHDGTIETGVDRAQEYGQGLAGGRESRENVDEGPYSVA